VGGAGTRRVAARRRVARMAPQYVVGVQSVVKLSYYSPPAHTPASVHDRGSHTARIPPLGPPPARHGAPVGRSAARCCEGRWVLVGVGHAPSRRPDLLSAQPDTPGRDTRLSNAHGRSASPPRRAAELQLKPRAGGGKAVCSAPAAARTQEWVSKGDRVAAAAVTRPDELACSAGSGERAGDAVRDDRARGAAGAERAEKGADSASRGGRDATGARRVASAA